MYPTAPLLVALLLTTVNAFFVQGFATSPNSVVAAGASFFRNPGRWNSRIVGAKVKPTTEQSKSKPSKDSKGSKNTNGPGISLKPGKVGKQSVDVSDLDEVDSSSEHPLVSPVVKYKSRILQPFETLRSSDSLYVDKTRSLYQNILMNTRSKYLFYARPPQFGKTLLCSTIANLFQGDQAKNLFDGLWIGKSNEWDFRVCRAPIIFLDMASFSGHDIYAQKFETLLQQELVDIGNDHGIEVNSNGPVDLRRSMGTLLRKLPELYDNRNTVVIVDNYDAPLTALASQPAQVYAMEAALQQFYGSIRAHESYYRLVFVTGSCRFAKDSIFKSFHATQDLSFKLSTGTLSGITVEELKEAIEKRSKHEAGGSPDPAAIRRLSDLYGGYRFGVDRNNGTLSDAVMNPASVSLAVNKPKSKIQSDGQSETFVQYHSTKSVLGCPIETSVLDTENLTTNLTSLIDSFDPLRQSLHNTLYDAGYITMRSTTVHPTTNRLTKVDLSVPNESVRQTLTQLR
jgi:hypothetical protein